MQMLCFGLFSVIAIRFHFTSRQFASHFEQRIHLTSVDGSDGKSHKYVEMDGFSGKVKRNWVAILRVTNIASICILVSYLLLLVILQHTDFTRSVQYIALLNLLKGETAICLHTNGREYSFNNFELSMLTASFSLYVFDALMILPVVSLFAWWHPGKYLPFLGFRLPKEAR